MPEYGEIKDINIAGNGPDEGPDGKAGDSEATPDGSEAAASDDAPAVDQPLADFVDAAKPEPKTDETIPGTPGVEGAVEEPEVTQQMPAVGSPDEPVSGGQPSASAPGQPTSGEQPSAATPDLPTSGEQPSPGTPTSGDQPSAPIPIQPTSGEQPSPGTPIQPTSGEQPSPATPAPSGQVPSGEEPAVTQQMPVVDVPPIEPTTSVEPTTGAPHRHEAPVGGAYREPQVAPPTSSDAIAPPSGERPRHMASGKFPAAVPAEPDREAGADRTKVLAIAAPVIVLVLLITAWAIDTATHSGQVLRNVELAGQSIEGQKEDDLPKIIAGIAEDMAARDVTIKSGDKVYQAKAGELGLTVDEKATVDAALDVGRGDSLFVRPVKWLGSFFSTRKAPVELSVNETTAAATLQRLQGADRTQPVEPLIQLAANGFVMVPGTPGVGINVDEVSEELREAALADPLGPITIEAASKPEAPAFTDEQAQALAEKANDMTANGLKLNANGHVADVPAPTLRGWLSQTVTDGKLDLAFNADAAQQALPQLLGGVTEEPKNATVTLGANAVPVVVPGENGVTCCGEEAGDHIWQALRKGEPEVALEATVKEPEFTTEEVTAWGIKQPVGGGRGYQAGTDIPSGLAPGFTTYRSASGSRNININKIADKVRGAVIPPGGEWSINDHVGKRTYAGGWVDAGAIRNGAHVDEVGGGISQFATTTFNAAYFAGLDILESQSHSEWFNRYPPGREATMGFPHPDVRIRNNTPYGVLIWTSYTPTSLTVTFYSTPYIKAEQTGKSESMSGACRVVVTTRTRTWPDGKTDQDQFKSTYRPEGKFCDGSAVPPPPPDG